MIHTEPNPRTRSAVDRWKDKRGWRLAAVAPAEPDVLATLLALEPLYTRFGPVAPYVAALDAQLALLPDAPSPLRARTRVVAGRMLQAMGHSKRAVETLRFALADAHAAGEQALVVDAASSLACACASLGEPDEAQAAVAYVRSLVHELDEGLLADGAADATRHALERLAISQPVVRVGPHCRWLLVGGRRLTFRRHGLLGRVLQALVARAESGEPPMTVADLLAAGWPEGGESSSGDLRVYTAISRLRQRGLAGVLEHDGHGYFLACQIVRDEGSHI
jgi:hypothetical protein